MGNAMSLNVVGRVLAAAMPSMDFSLPANVHDVWAPFSRIRSVAPPSCVGSDHRAPSVFCKHQRTSLRRTGERVECVVCGLSEAVKNCNRLVAVECVGVLIPQDKRRRVRHLLSWGKVDLAAAAVRLPSSSLRYPAHDLRMRGGRVRCRVCGLSDTVSNRNRLETIKCCGSLIARAKRRTQQSLIDRRSAARCITPSHY